MSVAPSAKSVKGRFKKKAAEKGDLGSAVNQVDTLKSRSGAGFGGAAVKSEV